MGGCGSGGNGKENGGEGEGRSGLAHGAPPAMGVSRNAAAAVLSTIYPLRMAVFVNASAILLVTGGFPRSWRHLPQRLEPEEGRLEVTPSGAFGRPPGRPRRRRSRGSGCGPALPPAPSRSPSRPPFRRLRDACPPRPPALGGRGPGPEARHGARAPQHAPSPRRAFARDAAHKANEGAAGTDAVGRTHGAS